jgi:predicted adenylyl cyclase CyaB
MQIENEVKYSVKNINSIKEKLVSCKFIFVKKIYQEDYYFSPPHKNFAGTKKYYLRLRRTDGGRKNEFAYHIVLNNLQTKELEVNIDNFENLSKILKLLDFKIDCVVKKERLVYKKNEIEIVLDKIKNLGSFIEIEYCGKFNNKIKKEFEELAILLKLKKTDKITGLGYPDLLMQKKYD